MYKFDFSKATVGDYFKYLDAVRVGNMKHVAYWIERLCGINVDTLSIAEFNEFTRQFTAALIDSMTPKEYDEVLIERLINSAMEDKQ